MTDHDQTADDIRAMVERSFDAVRDRAEQIGGFTRDLPDHVLAHLPAPGSAPRSERRLVITYDNLASVREREHRVPWGQEFLSAAGWDVLGVMVKAKDWFRHPALASAMEQLRDDGFFASYGAVSAFGSSMGGFGALTFAGCLRMPPHAKMVTPVAGGRVAWSMTSTISKAATASPQSESCTMGQMR